MELAAPAAQAVPGNRLPAQSGWRLELYRGSNGRMYFHFWLVKDRLNGKCHEANIGWKTFSRPGHNPSFNRRENVPR
jgi:hypothetical protein